MASQTSRPKLILARSWSLIYNVLDGLGAHRATQYAAAMSYYGLLSIFPAAIVLAAVAGFVLDDPGARQDVIDYLLRSEGAPTESAEGAHAAGAFHTIP